MLKPMRIDKLFGEASLLETERLVLRRMTMEDAEDYYSIASDPLVTAHTIWDTHRSKEESIQYITKVIERYEHKESFNWGIVLKQSNQLIGRIVLFHCDALHQKAEIGFGVSSRYWNMGIITEATQTIFQYAFEQLDLHRIEGTCHFNNLGSARVMEKLGMKFEGILREQLKIKGHFVDQRMYAILASDYLNSHEYRAK
jgi:[ribosomal protein S5]-alanine N-acetyltransferase